MINNNIYLAALDHLPWLSKNKLNKLIKLNNNDFKKAYNTLNTSILEKIGVENNICNEIFYEYKKSNLEELIRKLNKLDIKIATIQDSTYPKLLLETGIWPSIFYYKWSLESLQKPTLAVVGSRKISNYGKIVLNKLIPILIQNWLTIVSGLALWVDALAGKIALNNKGKTVAVLGNWLNKIYPLMNKQLSEDIVAKGGALISEYPLGTNPERYHFPQRNAIISGLSLGTLIVEAQKKSGSLITAQLALEQNREVFAIPGNINQPNSQGTNNLIKNGEWLLVNSAEDIINNLNISKKELQLEMKLELPLNDNEQKIIDTLKKGTSNIETLIKDTNLNIKEINTILTMLELKWTIKRNGNQYYCNF